jgi:hypothetical protein
MIGENARKMIQELNDSWKLLGVDEITRHQRTDGLVEFVQERYDEVVEETAEKVKSVVVRIDGKCKIISLFQSYSLISFVHPELRKEYVYLTQSLNVTLITRYDEETTLVGKRDVLERDLEG